jgi:hypothetical protein
MRAGKTNLEWIEEIPDGSSITVKFTLQSPDRIPGEKLPDVFMNFIRTS